MGEFTITILEDGTVKVDSSKVKGSADAIMKELESLARAVGGDLEVEEHVHGAHSHHHGDGKHHTHA